MSMWIREYQGYEKFDSEFNYSEGKKSFQEGLTHEDPISPNSIMVDIEGIHVGPTRNFTRYMESALKSSIRSWTRPYEKPLIMHHNDKDGKIIGRIKAVSYTEANTRSGTGALLFTANVPDKEGMEQIEDGRLTTTSIGIIGHDVRCSICGHNIAESGPCEHERGQAYGDEICYWDIYAMEAKELSYVIVPSDIYAKNTRIYKPTAKKTHISESLQTTNKGVSNLNLTEAEIKQLQDDVKKLTDDKDELEGKVKAAELTEGELATVKQELADAKAEIEALKGETKDPDQKLKDENAGLIKKLEDAKAEIEAVQKTLKGKESELEKEVALRESLESKSIEQNKTTKQALVENYAIMRKLAGKSEITMDKIQERTQDSLFDAIKDLKEELGDSISIANIQPVGNPSITESIEREVNKDKKASNIDLEEGLENLFNGIATTYSHK